LGCGGRRACNCASVSFPICQMKAIIVYTFVAVVFSGGDIDL
jgi:hypothetical protein